MRFPIDDVLTDILAALEAHHSLVLQAPPGAGKTTRVPLALLDASWVAGRKLVMLEPRRLAARSAANFMARQRGESAGQTIGYRIRFDTRVSAATRIEVVTEGVLTRMLQSDPALEDYAAVVFDEFHERSLHADLGLALALQSRSVLRPDLRMIAMSATLAGEPVAALLGNAPIVTSAGRSFPVETIYRPGTVTDAVLHALAEHEGDVLVFLPGAAEIHRTKDEVEPQVDRDTYVLPLFGNLTQAEQDRAIAPSRAGTRKVVLATSIAETSLTIEGVRIVIDSGFMRVPRFDARTGMTRLETITVTRASADQRRGRAGRVAPGVCYRLWSAHDDAALVPHSNPEILDADLAPLALDLAAWGITDANELAWLDPPPASSLAQAREILRELGALDDAGAINDHGGAMAKLPVHPRLAHMLLRGKELGSSSLACILAALLSERDILRGQGWIDSDIRLRIDRIDTRHRDVEQFRRLIHADDERPDANDAGLLLAFAYPDRIGKARGTRGKFLLRNGRGATVDRAHTLAGEDFIVAAEIEGSGRDSRVFMAAAITEEEIRTHFVEQIERVRSIEVTAGGTVQAIVKEQLGAIVLKESADTLREEEVAAGLLRLIRDRGVEALPWTSSSRQLQQRLSFLHHHLPEWPDFSMQKLHDTLEDWLLPHLVGKRSWADVMELNLTDAMLQMLDWQKRSQVNELAPADILFPSGSRIAVDYSNPDAPFAAVRLQEVFGMHETPRLANGRVPLTLQLLSPARRPVQVTRDLASFWKSGYFEVKKELKGRYPKHYWPDDPLVAEATRGLKRKQAE